MAAAACVEKSLAKEFAVCGVDQGVGRQNLRKGGECPSRSEKQTAASEFIALCMQACLKAADRAEGEESCLGLHAPYESAGLAGWQLFSSVVRLAKFVCEGFDQVNAFASEDGRRTLVHSQRHEGSPAGVRAKADGGGFHEVLRDGARVSGTLDDEFIIAEARKPEKG